MKNIVIIVFVFVTSISFSQNLSQYKYALIPSKFSFLNEPNQYRLNVLAKLYMEKYGFETYIDDEKFSEDFSANNTNKLYVDVTQNNNMFNTKIKIVLKDFQNNILFTSNEGVSRDKENTVAYNQAFRMAFDNFAVLKNHTFKPNKIINQNENIQIGETTQEILNNKLSVVKTPIGFDLYNIDNKLVVTAKKTSEKNVYIAIAGQEYGILRKDFDGIWFLEYYRISSSKLISERLLFTF